MANMPYRMSAFVTVPVKIHGRNFPMRVFVFSTTTPMRGSLNASNTRAAIIITPVNVPLMPSTVL